MAKPFDVNGLYGLRATLAAHASRLGADDEQIDHLSIVAGERLVSAMNLNRSIKAGSSPLAR